MKKKLKTKEENEYEKKKLLHYLEEAKLPYYKKEKTRFHTQGIFINCTLNFSIPHASFMELVKISALHHWGIQYNINTKKISLWKQITK